jgi:competence protein ComEC
MPISEKIIFLAFSFLLGIAIASLLGSAGPLIFLLLLSSFFVLIIDRKSWLVFALFGLVIGSAYFSISYDQRLSTMQQWQLEEKVVFLGTVVSLPETYSSGTRLKIVVDQIISANSSELAGKINLFGDYGLSEYLPGQRLMVSGRVVAVSEDFREYHLKEKTYGTIFYPSIREEGLSYKYLGSNLLARVREGAATSIEKKISEPGAGLIKAMLLGERLPAHAALSEKLRRTGLSHMAVVSGMHLIILSGLASSFLKKLKVGKSWRALILFSIIFAFIVLSGGRSSIWRAGLMAGFGLTGSLFGRPINPGRAIAWTALFLVVANPLILTKDIGFQLSLLAVVGLVYLSSCFKRLLIKVVPETIADLFSISLAAQIATAPLVAYHFHQISLIGPLANLLIVAFLPVIFSLGLLFLLLGGNSFLGLGIGLIVGSVLQIISIMSGLSWSSLAWSPAFAFILLYYGVFFFIVFKVRRQGWFFRP